MRQKYCTSCKYADKEDGKVIMSVDLETMNMCFYCEIFGVVELNATCYSVRRRKIKTDDFNMRTMREAH
jgi:hypothetical protein